MNLSPAQELRLNNVICSLHPHKNVVSEVRPRFYIIRRGLGCLNQMLKKDKKGAQNERE